MQFEIACIYLLKWSGSVVSHSLQPHGLSPTRLLCPWNFPGKHTAVGCHFLLQGIFPTQGSNPGLLHCRQILYHLSHQESYLSLTINLRNTFLQFFLSLRVVFNFIFNLLLRQTISVLANYHLENLSTERRTTFKNKSL